MPSHHHQSHYRFCPVCGGHLEPKIVKHGEAERPVCVECGYILYLDPKIAVGTIIRNDTDKIALVRRSIEPGYGKWPSISWRSCARGACNGNEVVQSESEGILL